MPWGKRDQRERSRSRDKRAFESEWTAVSRSRKRRHRGSELATEDPTVREYIKYPSIGEAIRGLEGLIDSHPSRLAPHINLLKKTYQIIKGEIQKDYSQNERDLKTAYVSILQFIDRAPNPRAAQWMIGGLPRVVNEMTSRRLEVIPVDTLEEAEKLLKGLDKDWLSDSQKMKVSHTLMVMQKFKGVGPEHEENQMDLKCACASMKLLIDKSTNEKGTNRLKSIAAGLTKCSKALTNKRTKKKEPVQSFEELLALLKGIPDGFVTSKLRNSFEHSIKMLEVHMKKEKEREDAEKRAEERKKNGGGFGRGRGGRGRGPRKWRGRGRGRGRGGYQPIPFMPYGFGAGAGFGQFATS